MSLGGVYYAATRSIVVEVREGAASSRLSIVANAQGAPRSMRTEESERWGLVLFCHVQTYLQHPPPIPGFRPLAQRAFLVLAGVQDLTPRGG